MLEALDVHDGDRVLEIGTGTGYNAALLCRRLGEAQVFSVDIKADLVASARTRLAGLGYHPTLVHADGALGLPNHAPYDRLIATCSVPTVPWAWIEQTRLGGVILADLKLAVGAGNLVRLVRTEEGAEGRFDPTYAAFMAMRSTACPDPSEGSRVRRDEVARRRYHTTVDPGCRGRRWSSGSWPTRDSGTVSATATREQHRVVTERGIPHDSGRLVG